ncbi:queuosine precursor transporter [bacterium]|nr:queuosine precursor transporter [bacterium]
MPNEVFWIILLLVDFCAALLVYRWLGREGLLILIVLHIIVCNLQVVKQVELFGLQATLGNISYGVTFWCTDLLAEKYGKREAARGVLIGFVALVVFTVLMQLALLFSPGPEDWANPHLQGIFGFIPRLVVASLLAYLISQFHDVWFFHYLRTLTRGRHLWLRNNLSTMVSQLLDTLVFCSVAFIGIFTLPVLVQIYLTTWLIKVLVAALDTPFIYLAARWHRSEGESAG